jgi:hypothetical protein
MMFKKIINFLTQKIIRSNSHYENVILSIGQIQSKLNSINKIKKISDSEFKAFSQWGEDGIIDYLVENLNIENTTFIEFGVEDYEESNTKFLLLNRNWKGFVIDSSLDYINKIKNSQLYWKYSIIAFQAFVTKENINQLMQLSGFKKQVGILSIDIDGNDYWIWNEIKVIEPSIVIIEYNSRLGKEKSYVVPYDSNFKRKVAHYSMIYYGASLKALIKLATQKGYAFVCCNKAGNNAFFVKKELLNDKVREADINDGYVENNFRESRDNSGNLIYLNKKEEIEIIFKLPLIEV